MSGDGAPNQFIYFRYSVWNPAGSQFYEALWDRISILWGTMRQDLNSMQQDLNSTRQLENEPCIQTFIHTPTHGHMHIHTGPVYLSDLCVTTTTVLLALFFKIARIKWAYIKSHEPLHQRPWAVTSKALSCYIKGLEPLHQRPWAVTSKALSRFILLIFCLWMYSPHAARYVRFHALSFYEGFGGEPTFLFVCHNKNDIICHTWVISAISPHIIGLYISNVFKYCACSKLLSVSGAEASACTWTCAYCFCVVSDIHVNSAAQ